MEAMVPSFMLSPSFTFKEDGAIRLGLVYPQAKNSKLANIRRPLSKQLSQESIHVHVFHEQDWHWNSRTSNRLDASVWADTSISSMVGASTEVRWSKEDSLDIRTSTMEEETFLPSDAHIKDLIADASIANIINRIDHPPVFLVTGRMVADGAEVNVVHGRVLGAEAHVAGDGSAALMPISAGIRTGGGKDTSSTLVKSTKERVVIGYQLLMIKKKYTMTGVDMEVEPVYKGALFDDRKEKLTMLELNRDDIEVRVVLPEDADALLHLEPDETGDDVEDTT